MKTKFVNVWDNRRWGYIGFIVLQVEATDKFLVEKNFNPGYKFVIQATYNHVGAAGGHTFIPSHGEGLQGKSRKIDTNEADVFGLYISNINNIYDIPDELDTKNFWGILNTKIDDCGGDKEIEYPCDEYYKVAYKRRRMSFNQMAQLFEQPNELLSKYLSNEQVNAIQNSTMKFRNQMIKMGADLNQESLEVRYGYVNKISLELTGVYWQISTNSNEDVINKYLWIQNDEMPKDIWDKVKIANNDRDVDDKDKLIGDEELYYS